MKSIEEYFKKIKPHEADVFISITIILIAFLSFGLGRLSRIEENKVPITIESAIDSTGASVLNARLGGSTAKSGSIVASKNGTKYHFPWCSGAVRMKDENKIWFNSEDEAKSAGYSPASNCKGLK